MSCEICRETLDEVKRLEDKNDVRYEEFIKCSSQYSIDKMEMKGLVKAIHKRMDVADAMRLDLNKALTEHMNEEAGHHLEVAKQLESVSKELVGVTEFLKHVPTKEDLAKTNGKMSTIWIIGIGLVILVGVLGTYVVEDVKSHVTKSSKANYNGVKKMIKPSVK